MPFITKSHTNQQPITHSSNLVLITQSAKLLPVVVWLIIEEGQSDLEVVGHWPAALFCGRESLFSCLVLSSSPATAVNQSHATLLDANETTM